MLGQLLACAIASALIAALVSAVYTTRSFTVKGERQDFFTACEEDRSFLRNHLVYYGTIVGTLSAFAVLMLSGLL